VITCFANAANAGTPVDERQPPAFVTPPIMQEAIIPTLPNWSLILGACWILGCLISGWSKGLVRQSLSLISLAGGGYAGYSLALPASQWLPESVLPGLLRLPVAALLGALSCWIVGAILSALLIKETENQKLGIIRLLWGFGGAALGVVYGIATLMVAYEIHRFGQSLEYGYAIGRRSARAQAESRTDKSAESLNPQDAVALKGAPTGPAAKAIPTPPIIVPDLRPKKPETLQGQFSHIAAAWDPVPERYYIRTSRFAEVFSNQNATARLFTAPDITSIGQALPQNFGFNVVVKDEALRSALRKSDLWGVLTNPNLAITLQSSNVRAKLNAINPDALLDFALTIPASTSK
jgi:hypothetical protein